MKTQRTSHFTFIELFAVMVVIAILASVAVPAFTHMMTGSGVEAGARILAANMRLARQYALSKRARLAVLLPANQGSQADRRFAALRYCIVDSSNVFEEWIQDSKWEFLPTGGVVVEIDDKVGYDGADKTDTVTGLPSDFGGDGTCRAIIFRSNGRLSGGHRVIHLVEGAYGSGAGPIIKNKDNHVDLEVDQYTGRLVLVWPEGE